MNFSKLLAAAAIPPVFLLLLAVGQSRADHGWREHQGFQYFYNDMDDVRYWYYHNNDWWYLWDSGGWARYAPYRPIAPAGAYGVDAYYGPDPYHYPGVSYYSPQFFGPKKPHPHGGPPGQTGYHPGGGIQGQGHFKAQGQGQFKSKGKAKGKFK